VKAPWQDLNGNDIFDGDTIKHPSGKQGTVVYKAARQEACVQWGVDYGDGVESRLCLQISDKGQAVKVLQ